MADIRLASLMVTFLVTLVLIALGNANELARGFNDDIDWVTLDEGLKKSQAEKKPLMLVIHKSWCGACKALKPHFATDKALEEESKNFVMVNTIDDEEPSDAKYSPDGGYIPRILFLDPEGVVLTDLINADGNEQYKYYYHSPSDIVKTMKRALNKSDKSGADEL